MGKKTHGLSSLPEHAIWSAMKSRCNNPKNAHYKNYGGRGISVSKEWEKSFEKFISDMGRRPSNEHTLDRINNEKGYEKNNCAWVHRSLNMRNKRNNIFVMFEGKRMILKDAAKKAEIPYETVRARIHVLGWTPQKALSQPVRSSENTHCRNGHKYEEGSFYRMPNGGRICYECRREYDRKRRPRKR